MCRALHDVPPLLLDLEMKKTASNQHCVDKHMLMCVGKFQKQDTHLVYFGMIVALSFSIPNAFSHS
jgi:hypothetical protein